jgi:hypothetical protein
MAGVDSTPLHVRVVAMGLLLDNLASIPCLPQCHYLNDVAEKLFELSKTPSNAKIVKSLNQIRIAIHPPLAFPIRQYETLTKLSTIFKVFRDTHDIARLEKEWQQLASELTQIVRGWHAEQAVHEDHFKELEVIPRNTNISP